MELFCCRTRILAGPGACKALKDFGAGRVLVVTDPFFVGNGQAERLAGIAGGAFDIFDGVQPDPSVELAARGTARLRSFQPELVVALGGGSAIDCAKAMVFFSGFDGPLAAVPTTSGSGSEVTNFAILTHNGAKHPLVDRRLQPHTAILDSDLLQELPRRLIADAGFDVLAHALEAIAGRNAGPISNALARDAFRTAFASLPASYSGVQSARLPVHTAAAMAALSFNQAGLGICHALSHALGGRFHTAHGRLNAILLPHVLDANAPAAGSRYAALARETGLGGAADSVALRNLKNGLFRLRRELSLPETLAQAGIAPEALNHARDALLDAALADPCCETNPMRPTRELLWAVLKEAAGRG